MVNKEKQIKDLSAEEFAELMKQISTGNFIEINGVIVQSSCESLDKCKRVACELIDKYSDFLLLRKELKLKTGYE